MEGSGSAHLEEDVPRHRARYVLIDLHAVGLVRVRVRLRDRVGLGLGLGLGLVCTRSASLTSSRSARVWYSPFSRKPGVARAAAMAFHTKPRTCLG